MKKIHFNDCFRLTQAVIEGRKTMFRQMVKPQPDDSGLHDHTACPMSLSSEYDMSGWWGDTEATGERQEFKPRYHVGEVVAVAQSYGILNEFEGISYGRLCRAVGHNNSGWHNKMFVCADLMPYRIRITGVRCERLRDISEKDCRAEGIEGRVTGVPPYDYVYQVPGWSQYYYTARQVYAAEWDAINGKGAWEANPWVWVYEFELLK